MQIHIPVGKVLKTGVKVYLFYVVSSTVVNLGKEVIRLEKMTKWQAMRLLDEREIIAEIQIKYPGTIGFVKGLRQRNQRLPSMEHDTDESDIPQS